MLADFQTQHGAPDLRRSIAVGDSLTSDVLPFLDRGVRFGAWLQRGGEGPVRWVEGYPNVAIVRDLRQLWSVSWPD